MAFVASVLTTEPRKFSLGPVQVEYQAFTMSSTDTTGSATASRLSRIDDVMLIGGVPSLTAAPTIAGSTVTFAFADPAAACTGYVAKTCTGYIMFMGR